MQFKAQTIVPGGRFKYGEYLAAGNVTNKVTKTIYGGNGTTENLGGGGDTGGDTGGTENITWQLFLSKGSFAFDWQVISALGQQSADTSVIGLLGTDVVETYVGDVTGNHLASSADSSGYYTYWIEPLPPTSSTIVGAYDYITGVPASGMTISVANNGDTGTTITITIDNTLPSSANTGTLQIPCAVSLLANQELGNEITDWEKAYQEGNVMQLTLEYSWSVSSNATTMYRLDLSNDAGSINCDDDGHVLTGATRPSCEATLYFGQDPYTAATYGPLEYNLLQNVVGLGSHTSNGVLYIDYDSPTYFDFDGDHLDITVKAYASSVPVGTKVFTITKSMPSEGHPATSYWLTFNSSSVKVNPNTNPVTVNPTAITANVMMQVGQDTPTAATGCSIYYGYTDSPATAYPNTGVTVDISNEALYFVAKKGNVIVDGVEQIPILKDGLKGDAGQSAYRLDLTNENASINCDSSGNILTGAVRPTCTAKLYLGTTACTGVTYSISSGSCSYSGVSINSSTGVITFNPGTASTPFNFDTAYTSMELTIQAKISNVLYGTAIMTISRNYAGENGDDAVNYWLVLDADEIKLTTANTFTPATITASAYKQIGENNPIAASDATIKWGYDTVTPTTTYTSTITVTGTSHNYITFQLLAGGVVRDTETVLILRDGKDGTGTQGRQGAAIRGPIDWYDGADQSGRRWCNGVLTDNAHPEDAQWIDIIIKDGVQYYCNTSYTEAGQPWSAVSSNWTSADTEFDFVATNILLANNAKIKFLTNNEIYLMDQAGTGVTAGAAGGEGISFWAGSDVPGNAPFQVNYDGSIRATSGIFSGYIQMKYDFVWNLQKDYQISGTSLNAIYLSQTNYLGSASTDPSVTASTSGDCYYNTTSNKYKYFKTSWATTATTVMSGYDEVCRGYIADNRAYLIADSYTGQYGMGDGGTLVLPAPASTLNGFVYDILVDANYATRSQAQEFTGLEVVTKNYGTGTTDKFYPYCFSSGNVGVADKLHLFGGRTRFVCVPKRNNDNTIGYVWAVTDATGGFKMFSGSNSTFVASYIPIQGYSFEEDVDPIYRINAYSTTPGSKTNDVLYVSRS